MGRLELPSLATYASETYAYTNSATCPYAYLTIQTVVCVTGHFLLKMTGDTEHIVPPVGIGPTSAA